ncbi:calcium-regulated heat-stable protein 1 [Petromyzon marinus]|uniref:Calcium-regulated heat-stable protein 1 n=1 Tax=Petromyzon marinus TaxID=7757 RepID=A0AAJ7X1Q1_PETMA|nr:calcium-regulated heat-stable protein 1 [Petromyzon marinus]
MSAPPASETGSSPRRAPHSPTGPGDVPTSLSSISPLSPKRDFLLPSPLPTRRSRTYSAAARAAAGPSYRGVCKFFCRSKGHGFITPEGGGADIYVHISDVEGEYVPVEGDEVCYKLCCIPPKMEKHQAVEVSIIHLAPGSKHETWSGHPI